MTDPDPHAEDHRRAAEAAAAYRSHAPVRTPPHRISIEDEAVPPPPRPRATADRRPQANQPRVLVHRLDAPFGTAFFAALGWSAGRAVFRLVALVIFLALLAAGFWRVFFV